MHNFSFMLCQEWQWTCDCKYVAGVFCGSSTTTSGAQGMYSIETYDGSESESASQKHWILFVEIP